MKKSYFIFFVIVVITNIISYRFGSISGKEKETNSQLGFYLAANVTNYDELNEGKLEQVKHNLAILINGDLMAYDSFKKTNPNYQIRNAAAARYLEKAREIQNKTKPDSYAIPVK